METPFIRFKFAARKAHDALHWMVQQRDRVDLHTAMKACYFSDVEHLNRYGRPIFGATYRAMRYGPVPIEIYEMAKAEPYWLAELGQATVPWTLTGYHLVARNRANPETRSLSRSDMAALEEGFRRASSMTFDQRTAATHGPDWERAALGWMSYEDMVRDDNPAREEIIADLRDSARFLVL